MTDDRFEQRLRGFLATREPATVSPVLRARLQSVTAESPVRSGGWIGWLGGAWRATVGLAAVTAVAVVVLAALLRTDALTVQDPGPIGGPSAPPVVPAIPFITAPADLFSPDVRGRAERALAGAFEAAGIEATLIVQPVANGDDANLSSPPGWPEQFDRDGDRSRDVLVVIGLAPDGTTTCCMTSTGALIERAKAEGYWRVQAWPTNLRMDIGSDDPRARDAALARFADGIVRLTPGIAQVERDIAREADLVRILWFGGLGVAAAATLLVYWRRRRASPAMELNADAATISEVAAASSGPLAQLGGAPAMPLPSSTPASGFAAGSEAAGVDLPSVSWSASVGTGPRDRWLLALAASAVVGLIGLAVAGGTSSGAAPLDPSAVGVGLARAALPIIPGALVLTAIASLMVMAWRGGWRRKIGILGLIAVVGWSGVMAIESSRPGTEKTEETWVGGLGAGPVEHFGPGGFSDYQPFLVGPGEPFTLGVTITNPGPLPITILGLDGIQLHSPSLAIVGLARIPQPTADGTVTVISARPADAVVSWPVTMAPGDDVALVFLGRGGACASPDGIWNTLPTNWIDLTYRVAGWDRVETIGLPVTIAVPTDTACVEAGPQGVDPLAP